MFDNSNLFWCIVGIIGGAIFSLFISVFFYFKGLDRKRLTYDIKTFCIVSNKINQIEGLEVKYKSTDIENLYSSTITIKNVGNTIVEKNDLAPLCPISISTSGQFLKTKYNYITSSPINKISQYNIIFSKKDMCSYIDFNFDYIPKKAIITFSLFHTGELSFNGTLKDGKIMSTTENQKRNRIYNFILDTFFEPV